MPEGLGDGDWDVLGRGGGGDEEALDEATGEVVRALSCTTRQR